MSRTVTALYDTRAEAESAKQRLSSAVDVECAKIVDQQASQNSGSSEQQEQGSGLSGLAISSEDRHAYGEGIKRGGFLLCAEVDGDEDADKIVSILEETPSVDMDDRQQDWKTEGWSPFATTTNSPVSSEGANPEQSSAVEEERIPIVEEEMHVGKRQVERGGARVRSYIRETPVHEQVNLREEHLSIERRPVNKTVIGEMDGHMLRERNIEMTETAEVPVVEKEARVTEEMVIRKTADERTEDVEGTVRRTEVEVDDTAGGNKSGSAFGFKGNDAPTSAETGADFVRSESDRAGKE